MGDDRLSALIARFDDSVRALQELLGGLAADDWARVCRAEGWSVGLQGLHVALGFRRQQGFLDDAFVRGKPARFDWRETHALNAQIAGRRRPSRRFVMRFLDEEAGRVRERLAILKAEDLDRTAIDYEGRLLTLDQFIRGFLIGHVEGPPSASIRAAVP